MVQGKESEHFMRIFKGTMIVYRVSKTINIFCEGKELSGMISVIVLWGFAYICDLLTNFLVVVICYGEPLTFRDRRIGKLT